MENKVSGIIINTTYAGVGDTSKIELFGKSMYEWVSLAVDGPTKGIDNNEALSVLDLIRPFLNPQAEYTVVLYSDTPLITKKTVCTALKDLEDAGTNVVRMARGFIFKTAFALIAEKLYTDSTRYYDEEDFITASSLRQVAYVREVLHNRILTYHMSRGVYVEDLSSTFIGSEVTIEAGAKICAFNNISGNTIIKANALIGTGNNIKDCVIDEGASVLSSTLVHSYVGKNAKIGPYANIDKDNVIADRCEIGGSVSLNHCQIREGCIFSPLSSAQDVSMGKGCFVGEGAVFTPYNGTDKHVSVIGDNVVIGAKAVLIAPVKIGDKSFIPAGERVTRDVLPTESETEKEETSDEQSTSCEVK